MISRKTRCVKHGIHVYGTYFEIPELIAVYDALARENLAKLGPLTESPDQLLDQPEEETVS